MELRLGTSRVNHGIKSPNRFDLRDHFEAEDEIDENCESLFL